VTNKTAATRYARALLDVAIKEKADLERIEQELADFAGLLAQHPALEKVLLNPAVPVPRKHGVVVELTTPAKLSPIGACTPCSSSLASASHCCRSATAAGL